MSIEEKLAGRVDEILKWVGSEHKQTCDRAIEIDGKGQRLTCTCGLLELREFLQDLEETPGRITDDDVIDEKIINLGQDVLAIKEEVTGAVWNGVKCLAEGYERIIDELRGEDAEE